MLADDPLLTVRLGGKRHQPRRVVLDSQLRISEDCQVVRTAHEAPVLLYTLEETLDGNSAKAARLRELGCELISTPSQNNRPEISSVLTDLGRRGVTELLVEGGATILKAFVEQQLVDKFMIYIAPLFIGNQEKVAKVDFGISYNQLHDIKITKFDTDILIEAFTEKLEL